MIGGDHSLAVGSVAGTSANAPRRRRALGLLWVDAHADMNTPLTTVSGNVHGIPLAALLGPEPTELARIGDFTPVIRPDRVALVGVRSLDQQEKELVRAAGVHLFTMSDIDRTGLARVTRLALALILRGNADLHVSFDLNVCDPAIAPGVGNPRALGAELSRSALADGAGRRHQTRAGAGSSRGESGSRQPQYDSAARCRVGAFGILSAEHVERSRCYSRSYSRNWEEPRCRYQNSV